MIDARSELKRGGVKGLFRACGVAGPPMEDARRWGRDLAGAWAAQDHAITLLMVAARCHVPIPVIVSAMKRVVQDLARELHVNMPVAALQALVITEYAKESPGIERRLSDAMRALRVRSGDPVADGLCEAARGVLACHIFADCSCGLPDASHARQVIHNGGQFVVALGMTRADHGKRTGRVPPGTPNEQIAIWASQQTADAFKRYLRASDVLAARPQLVRLPGFRIDEMGQYVGAEPTRGQA